jgi:hypothetical protein
LAQLKVCSRSDVLGLVVDLSAINLNISAVSGPGALLGNLLCALVGLLDDFALSSGLYNLLQSILDLIEQINDILSP